MKTERTKIISSQEKPLYPCLKESCFTGNIVLFTSPRHGTVIHLGKTNNSSYDIGEYKPDFMESKFSLLPANFKLTLSN